MIPDDLNPGALRHSNMVYLGLAAASVAAVTLSSPEILTLADGETERDAVLLECCTLADKRLTITEADLDGIVARFTSPVPYAASRTFAGALNSIVPSATLP